MMYVQASIKLRAGKLPDFVKLLSEISPFIGKHGWKLVGSYASVVGRLNTVVDWWEIPNADAVPTALADPEFAKWGPRIAEIVEDETLTILTKLPIG
ncbi:MAG TPA: NIPSNAP family protein [Candidatus Binataceae bacterium]|nr:NIPSNAP family protein [Candidatus Binataceae bacterium]